MGFPFAGSNPVSRMHLPIIYGLLLVVVFVERFLYLTRFLLFMSIRYVEPVFKNFGKDYKGFRNKWFSEGIDDCKGVFVATALENSLQTFALGGAMAHGQALGQARDSGLSGACMGGGSIYFNPDQKVVSVRSRSLDFGTLPNQLLEEYFSFFGYEVKADMFWDMH